jgi:RNA polymerase sigma factor (sigma-70 family)
VRSDELALVATVQAATAGDERAWNALVHRFTPTLRRVAKSFRLAPHEVDDVVQACWLSLLGSLHTLREPAAIGGWLVTAARRQSLRARQGVVREVLTESPLDNDDAAPDCLESLVIEAERVGVLRDAVRRLPGRQRVVLESLIEEPDRSYAAVSEDLGMPIGSIGPTRERGINRLRQDERLAKVVAS